MSARWPEAIHIDLTDGLPSERVATLADAIHTAFGFGTAQYLTGDLVVPAAAERSRLMCTVGLPTSTPSASAATSSATPISADSTRVSGFWPARHYA